MDKNLVASKNRGIAVQAITNLQLVKALGCDLKFKSTILDFGCGNGESVQILNNLGYQAFGCDIELNKSEDKEILKKKEEKTIRLINQNPYQLPFEDQTFDFVFSNQVFEHVQNYSESISEIKRVLKDDGCCLHNIPSRLSPIESHTFVPLASIIKSYSWLYFWAFLGIRNRFQKGLSANQTARTNYDYLTTKTNYLTKKQIRKHFEKHFEYVFFCEKLSFRYRKNRKKGKILFALSTILPFIPSLFSTFHSRVVYCRKKSLPLNNSLSKTFKS